MTAFFDTNIIVYAMGGDERRRTIAEMLLVAGGWISVQVLNELVNASREWLKYDWPKINQIFATARSLVEVCDLTEVIHDRGRFIAERYKLSVYDSMLVAAAAELGCDTLYSEDMHNGLVVSRQVRIVNPFLPN